MLCFLSPSPLSSVFSKKSPGGLLFRLCLLFFVWKWNFGAQFKLILSGNFLTYNDHWKGLWDEHFWFEITWIIWGKKAAKTKLQSCCVMSKRSWNDYKELDVDGHYCLRRASLRALETVPQKTWQTLLFSTCSFLIRFCLFRKVKKPSNKKIILTILLVNI